MLTKIAITNTKHNNNKNNKSLAIGRRKQSSKSNKIKLIEDFNTMGECNLKRMNGECNLKRRGIYKKKITWLAGNYVWHGVLSIECTKTGTKPITYQSDRSANLKPKPKPKPKQLPDYFRLSIENRRIVKVQ